MTAGATFRVGLPEALTADAARLYLEAFDAKTGPVLGRDERAEAFLVSVIRPSHAFSVIGPDGALLGVAGFHDDGGGLISGGFADMRRVYGLFSAAWRMALLSLFERSATPGELLLDGIVIAPAARGAGLGRAFLRFIAATARDEGLEALRLEVIDVNPRARSLYAREGFVTVSHRRSPFMRPVFGFGSVETMRMPLRDDAK